MQTSRLILASLFLAAFVRAEDPQPFKARPLPELIAEARGLFPPPSPKARRAADRCPVQETIRRHEGVEFTVS